MKVNLTLQIKSKNAKVMHKAILPDFEKKGRADVSLEQKGNSLIFEIESEDLTSVRATINNIILKLRALNELDSIRLE